MAAFSFQNQNHPLFLDSVFYSNPPPTTTTTNSYFLPQFYQIENPPHNHEINISMDFSVHESCNSLEEHSNNNNGGTSVINKQSPASSSVVQLENGEEQKLLANPIHKKRKYKNGSSLNTAQSKNANNKIGKKQKKSINGDVEEEKKSKQNKKVANDQEGHPPPPTGYIHVKARRGQATDSHSLAERVRREKISERMKLLQAIVPGCDKVTGKALMLDEIINYVQSLQNQVEFLSMRLASVNPMFYDFGVDLEAFMVKPENLSSLEPQMPNNIQQCSPTGSANTFATPNNYPLVDTSTSALQLQQGHQIHNILSQSQGNGQVLWGVDGQRQKLINQNSTLSNNLCSFH